MPRGQRGQVFSAMAAALAAVLLAPLNDRISNWAEQRFQHDLVQLKTRLPDLLSEFPATWSTRQVGKAVLPEITGAIHATSGAIIINDKVITAEAMPARKVTHSSDQFPLRLPLRCNFGTLRGALLIGPRPDGSSYGKDETEAVEAVLPALSRALLSSVERERRRRRALDFQRRVQSQLDRLSMNLDALSHSVSAVA